MITINVGGHEYDSWDALPEDVRAQLVAAGVDPGPDGRLDSVDLSRAHGAVSRRTVVTGPGGTPLPPVVAHVLRALFDALDPSASSAPRASEDPEAVGVLGTQGAVAPSPRVPDDRTGAAAPQGAGEVEDTHPAGGADGADSLEDEEARDGDLSAGTPGRSRRVPLVFGLLVIGATVLLVATVFVIGLAGV